MTLRSFAFTGLLRFFSFFPLPILHTLSLPLAATLYLIPNQVKRIARINIQFCWPELDKNQQARLLRQNLIETCKTALELGPLWLWPSEKVISLIRNTEGRPAWDDAVAQGRGVIVLAPHQGCWEIAGPAISAKHPFTIMFRPGKLGIDSLMRSARSRGGATLVPTDKSGVRAQLMALRSGGVVGLLPDQDPDREGGRFSPFFGHSVNTMVLLSRLAQKSGAPVFSVVAKRLPRGQGFDLSFRHEPRVSADDLQESVDALNQAVEQRVREGPEQYLWAYKRFKTLPPGERKIYS